MGCQARAFVWQPRVGSGQPTHAAMSSHFLRSEYLCADKQRDSASAGICLAILALLFTGTPLLCGLLPPPGGPAVAWPWTLFWGLLVYGSYCFLVGEVSRHAAAKADLASLKARAKASSVAWTSVTRPWVDPSLWYVLCNTSLREWVVGALQVAGGSL